MNELSSFLREYSKKDILRLFMPGHQGICKFLNKYYFSRIDITEIKGADNLYYSTGIIKSLEDELSKLYNCEAYISAAGSTLCVQTVLWLLKDRRFVVARGAHVSFYNMAAILNIDPLFIGNYETVDILDIEKALLKSPKGTVLYITSPNYYGEVLDIFNIKKLCKKYGVILVVDSAHGAHLRFTKNNNHPTSLGADFCFSSFHKTLPALTGAAVLFLKVGIFKKNEVKSAMAIFGSSSPSYVIMDSIGLCVDWLKKYGFSFFDRLEKNKDKLILKLKHLNFLKTDPSKLVLDCSNVEGGVFSVLKILRKKNIEPEFFNLSFICFILSPFLKKADFDRLYYSLKEIKTFEKKYNFRNKNSIRFKKGVTLKQAIYSKKETINVEDANSRICASTLFAEIPGVLLIAYGEVINIDIVNRLKIAGIEKIEVVSE